MGTILGRRSSLSGLRRMHARTRVHTVTIYEGGNDDGRGGQAPPTEYSRADCDVKALTGDKATEFLGERLRFQEPHSFFFAHDVDLPDECYIMHDGTLYREEVRQQGEVKTTVITVRAEQQDTA